MGHMWSSLICWFRWIDLIECRDAQVLVIVVVVAAALPEQYSNSFMMSSWCLKPNNWYRVLINNFYQISDSGINLFVGMSAHG